MAFMAEGIYTMGRSGPTRCMRIHQKGGWVKQKQRYHFFISLFILILARIDVLIPVSCWYFYFILPSVAIGRWKYILISWRCVVLIIVFVTCIDRTFPAIAWCSVGLCIGRVRGRTPPSPESWLVSRPRSRLPRPTSHNAKDNVIALAFDYWSTSRFFDIEHITARVSLGRKETTVAFSFPFDCI